MPTAISGQSSFAVPIGAIEPARMKRRHAKSSGIGRIKSYGVCLHTKRFTWIKTPKRHSISFKHIRIYTIWSCSAYELKKKLNLNIRVEILNQFGYNWLQHRTHPRTSWLFAVCLTLKQTSGVHQECHGNNPIMSMFFSIVPAHSGLPMPMPVQSIDSNWNKKSHRLWRMIE